MSRLGTDETVQVLRASGGGREHQVGAHTPARAGTGIGLRAAARTQHLPPGIMKHLEILREAGLVSAERDGRAVVYQVTPARLGDIAAALDELSRGWDRRLAAIKRAAESRDSTAD